MRFATGFWRRRAGRQFSAAPFGRKSLKMRPPAFGLRAAIPAAWPISPYRRRFPLDLACRQSQERQSQEPRPGSRRTRRRTPRARLPLLRNSRDCWLAWLPPLARPKAKFAPVRRKQRPRRVLIRRQGSRHFWGEPTRRRARRNPCPNRIQRIQRQGRPSPPSRFKPHSLPSPRGRIFLYRRKLQRRLRGAVRVRSRVRPGRQSDHLAWRLSQVRSLRQHRRMRQCLRSRLVDCWSLAPRLV